MLKKDSTPTIKAGPRHTDLRALGEAACVLSMRAFLLILYLPPFFLSRAGDGLSVNCQSVCIDISSLPEDIRFSATPPHPFLCVCSQQDRYIPLFSRSQSSQPFFMASLLPSLSLPLLLSSPLCCLMAVYPHLNFSPPSYFMRLRQ